VETFLEVQGVRKRFRNGRGIGWISLDIKAGDIVGLFGQNGAGKTTLLKVITSLCRPDEGNIRMFGYDLDSHYEQAMAQVGCVIEAADAYDYMTGRQNLRQAARYYPELPPSRIDEVLEMTGLTLKRVLMNIANNGGQSAWRGDNNTCTCGALRFACT